MQGERAEDKKVNDRHRVARKFLFPCSSINGLIFLLFYILTHNKLKFKEGKNKIFYPSSCIVRRCFCCASCWKNQPHYLGHDARQILGLANFSRRLTEDVYYLLEGRGIVNGSGCVGPIKRLCKRKPLIFFKAKYASLLNQLIYLQCQCTSNDVGHFLGTYTGDNVLPA